MRGRRVCRMHGAGGGGPEGKKNGNFRHGGRTRKAIELTRQVNAMGRVARRSD